MRKPRLVQERRIEADHPQDLRGLGSDPIYTHSHPIAVGLLRCESPNHLAALRSQLESDSLVLIDAPLLKGVLFHLPRPLEGLHLEHGILLYAAISKLVAQTEVGMFKGTHFCLLELSPLHRHLTHTQEVATTDLRIILQHHLQKFPESLSSDALLSISQQSLLALQRGNIPIQTHELSHKDLLSIHKTMVVRSQTQNQKTGVAA